MNAILCDIEIESGALISSLPDTFSRLGTRSTVNQAHCPFCESVIYSRRAKLCGVCAEVLPAECRFDEDQAYNVELILREERQRHRAWMQRFADAN